MNRFPRRETKYQSGPGAGSLIKKASLFYPAFLCGDYATAIFQSFKEVEVAVRQAGQFSQDMVGDKLMRSAFAVAKNNGPAGRLTDTSLPTAEQEAMGHLFAGAFGVYRNAEGHRHVFREPESAAEIIMLASCQLPQ